MDTSIHNYRKTSYYELMFWLSPKFLVSMVNLNTKTPILYKIRECMIVHMIITGLAKLCRDIYLENLKIWSDFSKKETIILRGIFPNKISCNPKFRNIMYYQLCCRWTFWFTVLVKTNLRNPFQDQKRISIYLRLSRKIL